MALELGYRRIDRSAPGAGSEWLCRNVDMSICEWMGDGRPAAIRAPRGTDGVLLRLQLADLPPHRATINARSVRLDAMPAGSVMLHDLQDEPEIFLDAASHAVVFFLSRRALRRGAERDGGLWHEALRTEMVAPDPMIHNLAQCLLPDMARRASSCVRHVAQALVAHVLATYGRRAAPEVARGGLARWQVRRATDMLGADLMKRSELTEVARECGLSLSHFSRSFRQTVGDTPHGWLIRRRLERAQAMLRDSGAPLAEIALSCGFADQSHFTRLFSREMGVSPGSWRRAQEPRAVRA
jgi:AraC-like DNA-binding protein